MESVPKILPARSSLPCSLESSTEVLSKWTSRLGGRSSAVFSCWIEVGNISGWGRRTSGRNMGFKAVSKAKLNPLVETLDFEVEKRFI